ncbi:MAG TPA: N-formylglutamate amidohydrolase [Actinomycetota bacterium]|nr:N-formylglutamate amidohydrolase [Actinomycetota bacterium]
MTQAPFTLDPVERARLPLIAHIPHSGTHIPRTIRSELLLGDEDLRAEVLRVTDHFTDRLFASAAEAGGVRFVNHVSRLVFDPERFRDDADEVMASRGAGAIYSTTSDGRNLRSITASRREEVLVGFFDPYASAMADAVDEMKRRFGCCLILDCHSFPRVPLGWELHLEGARPQIDVGTDPFHSPADLVTALTDVCAGEGLVTSRDHPFTGCYVPMRHYRRDQRTWSVMIEIRRDLYMDESTGAESKGFASTAQLVDQMIGRSVQWLEERINSGR